MSRPLIDRPDRLFEVWVYTAGMRRLILRSTKSEEFATRIDVLFQNVKALNLPTLLDGLVVTLADREAEVRISDETGLLPGDMTFFEIECAGRLGYVVAGVVAEDEDEGEYFEPSKYWKGDWMAR